MNTKYEGSRTNILQITQSKKAFTLVELIIVITILAILATIAFISFKNYAGSARDGNKLTTLSNIEKGLSLYQVKTGTYPTPDTPYGSGNYSGALISQVGYIGSEVIQAINMNKVPKDPIVDFEYTYGLSNNKKYYQLGSVLENNQMSLVNQTYAKNYTSKVVGNYKGLYRFGTGGENYIMNLPSLIFTQTGTIHLENLENPKFVINNGGNLVKPYHENNNESIDTALLKLTGTGVSLTGAVIPPNFDWSSGSGILKDSLGYSEDTIGHKIYGDDYVSGNNNLQIPPVSGGEDTGVQQWKDLPDTHCDNDDYVFTYNGTTYRWAGCNSVLGTGVGEWPAIGSYCYNYTGGGSISCGTSAQMLSTAKENAWNTTTGTQNNIWGKLYTYDQASATTGGACPSGWHLPSNEEWTDLETYLNEGIVCRTINCPGLGWQYNHTKTANTNIIQALKLPLAGYRYTSGTAFSNRGYETHLWSSSESEEDAYRRYFWRNNDVVSSYLYAKTHGFSVRCVKD